MNAVTAPATGTMTAGEAFAALMEDYLTTAGFAIGVLDCAEAVYPAPYFATVPRGCVTIRFRVVDAVTLDFTPNA